MTKREDEKVITAKFPQNKTTKKNNSAPINSRQTNPIYKQLFKFTHADLTDKSKNNSSSKFSPDDLF